MILRYKSLFFDLDNTLWDTIHDNKKCLEGLFVDHHFDQHYASFEAFYAIYQPYNELLWERYQRHEINRRTLMRERMLRMLRPMGIDDPNYALHLNDELIERSTHHTTLLPGALILLNHLYPFYRLFILSNGFCEVQRLKMERAGLLPYFDRLILSEEVGARKPRPVFFDYALTHTNTRRNEVLMIGDSYLTDIAGALRSNIDALWLNPTSQPPPAGEPLPTYTVRSLDEIREML